MGFSPNARRNLSFTGWVVFVVVVVLVLVLADDDATAPISCAIVLWRDGWCAMGGRCRSEGRRSRKVTIDDLKRRKLFLDVHSDAGVIHDAVVTNSVRKRRNE